MEAKAPGVRRLLAPQQLEALCLLPTDSLRDVVTRIDQGCRGIALVTDAARRLIGTITDGDVRRAILAGRSLDSPAQGVLDQKSQSTYARPVTATVGTRADDLLTLMQRRQVRHLPLLDEEHRVVDLATLDDLLPTGPLALEAVIMAGGRGTRLRPLTEDLPKPMLPVGDRPLMELTIEQLRRAGIQRVNITTHYRPEKITEHFGDGSDFGVEVSYVEESRPLGTAGALGLLGQRDGTLLVINGDILTRVDFRAMLAYHHENGAELTVGLRSYEMDVPYGIVDCQGNQVVGVREKPRYRFLVNAGIYLLEPSACAEIPRDVRCDMTELIQRLLDQGRSVCGFPITEYWLDIGKPLDYEQAQRDMAEGRLEG